MLSYLSVAVDSSSAWEYDRDGFLEECARIAGTKGPTFLRGAEGRVPATSGMAVWRATSKLAKRRLPSAVSTESPSRRRQTRPC